MELHFYVAQILQCCCTSVRSSENVLLLRIRHALNDIFEEFEEFLIEASTQSLYICGF